MLLRFPWPLPTSTARSMAERRFFVPLALAPLLAAIAMPAAVTQDGAAADRSAGAVELADGPYVDNRDPIGWRTRIVGRDGAVVEGLVSGSTIRVPAVAGVPSFDVPLLPIPAAAVSAEPLSANTPLLVLADTHGEYPILVALLRAQGIVGMDLSWTFGRGHLVVTGDMLDRGMHQLEILWLLYKLEAEANAAGGRVHVLIGNHEAMVLRGDQRYLNPRYLEVAKRFGVSAYSELLGPDTVLGAWLRSRPAVLKLGDLLLLHGGLSPELTASTLSLEAVNAIARRHLDMPQIQRPAEDSDDALVMGSDGPLWYRGYFPMGDNPPAASDADVAASLARFGVVRILVGHTIVESVRPLYNGKVIAMQVYPHRDETSGAPILEGALRIEGKWYRGTAQGERFPLGLAD